MSDPDENAGLDPIAVTALERHRTWLSLLARLQVNARFRANSIPPTSSSRPCSKPCVISPSSAAAPRPSWPPGCGRSWHVLLHQARHFAAPRDATSTAKSRSSRRWPNHPGPRQCAGCSNFFAQRARESPRARAAPGRRGVSPPRRLRRDYSLEKRRGPLPRRSRRQNGPRRRSRPHALGPSPRPPAPGDGRFSRGMKGKPVDPGRV